MASRQGVEAAAQAVGHGSREDEQEASQQDAPVGSAEGQTQDAGWASPGSAEEIARQNAERVERTVRVKDAEAAGSTDNLPAQSGTEEVGSEREIDSAPSEGPTEASDVVLPPPPVVPSILEELPPVPRVPPVDETVSDERAEERE